VRGGRHVSTFSDNGFRERLSLDDDGNIVVVPVFVGIGQTRDEAVGEKPPVQLIGGERSPGALLVLGLAALKRPPGGDDRFVRRGEVSAVDRGLNRSLNVFGQTDGHEITPVVQSTASYRVPRDVPMVL
jgi:hypothetical protein